jgi:glycerol-3-phosphate dehydrogenase
MERRPEALEERPFDLLVIGGGFAGCATAWDAARRGWSVALIEREDFGAGVSAACYRIVHGGLRHLAGFDLPGFRLAVRERAFFLRALPHQVTPLAGLLPARRNRLTRRPAVLRAALALNDALGWDRNCGVRDPAARIPAGGPVPAHEIARLCPFLPTAPGGGGVRFHDAVLDASERTVFAFAEAAARAGAVVLNHLAAEGADRRADGAVEAVRARDTLSGRELRVRARVVLDCAGPAAGGWLAPAERPARFSAGLQLVTGPVQTGGHLVAFAAPDGKEFFAMPRRGETVWGTFDSEHHGAPEDWRIEESGIAAFLEVIRRALPGLEMRRDQVRRAFGGLRPWGCERSARAASRAGGLRPAAAPNVWTLTAAKFTTARALAERALDQVRGRLPTARRCDTAAQVLPGGDFASRAAWRRELRLRLRPGVGEGALDKLIRLHGAEAARIPGVLLAEDDAALRDALLAHARLAESALTPDDLARRLGCHGETEGVDSPRWWV